MEIHRYKYDQPFPLSVTHLSIIMFCFIHAFHRFPHTHHIYHTAQTMYYGFAPLFWRFLLHMKLQQMYMFSHLNILVS